MDPALEFVHMNDEQLANEVIRRENQIIRDFLRNDSANYAKLEAAKQRALGEQSRRYHAEMEIR